MSELTNVFARNMRDLTTPTSTGADPNTFDSAKIPIGNAPQGYEGTEALTVKQIKDLAAAGRKEELDALNLKISAEEIRAKEVEATLNNDKANKATTLSGYGISDAYTQGQIDSKVNNLESKKANKVEVDTAFSNLSITANKYYSTLAEANADIANIALNQSVTIGEEANMGLWEKKTAGATSLTKSPYDPVKIMRDDIADLDSLRINKDTLYPYIFVSRGIAYSEQKSIFEKNLLSVRVRNATPDCYYMLNYMVHKPSDPQNTDDRNNGWQFMRIPKSTFADATTGKALTNIRQASSKFKLEPNTGIVRFEIPASIFSNGEVFEVVFDTTGIDSDFIYDGYVPNGHAYQRVIDPILYDVDSYGLPTIKGDVDSLSKLDNLTINKNKLYPFTQKKRGTYSKNSVLTTFEKSILSIRVNNASPNTYYRISYLMRRVDGFLGWQVRSIDKDVYENTDDLGVVLGDVHEITTAQTTEITTVTLYPPRGDISIDITYDASMWLSPAEIYVSNRFTFDGFDHIIHPSNYVLKKGITTSIIPDAPTTSTLYHGFLPIDEYGAADFNNILMAKDIDALITPASVVKVMTALVALESSLKLTDMITVGEEGTISNPDVKEGDILTFFDALHVMLLPSSNATSISIAKAATGGDVSQFVELMNKKARSLGMQNTTYVDTSGIGANRMSVRDTLILMYAASKNYVIKDVWGESTYTATVTGTNPRPLVVNSTLSTVLSNDWCLGGKTGTSGNKFNLACYVELKNGFRGVVAVMRSDTATIRNKDLVDITNYVRNAYLFPETRKLTPLS